MGVRSLPTMIAMNESKVQQVFIGVTPLTKLFDFMDNLKLLEDLIDPEPDTVPDVIVPDPDEEVDYTLG